jgi:transposase-like protein
MADPQAPGPQPPAGLKRYKRLDKRWQRYEKQLPGHQVQINVKFVEPLSTATRPAVGRRTKYYQFTAIDDCTRLRVLRIYPRCDQKTAIQFVDYVLERLPFPVQVIQTDNGAEFQSAFHYHVSVTRSSSHPRARVGRDGAASGYALCSRALRMRRGPKPTAPHGPTSHG